MEKSSHQIEGELNHLDLEEVCNKESIGERLQLLRKKYGATQEKVAKELYMSRTYLSHIENDGSISDDNLTRLAHYYKVAICTLRDGILPDYESLKCETGLEQASINTFKSIFTHSPELTETLNMFFSNKNLTFLLCEILYFYAYEDLSHYSVANQELKLGPSRSFLNEESLLKLALADKVQLLLVAFRNSCADKRLKNMTDYQARLLTHMKHIMLRSEELAASVAREKIILEQKEAEDAVEIETFENPITKEPAKEEEANCSTKLSSLMQSPQDTKMELFTDNPVEELTSEAVSKEM